MVCHRCVGVSHVCYDGILNVYYDGLARVC